MFPYNDDENAWISKSSISKTKVSKDSFIFSILFAFTAALFSTTVPPLAINFLSCASLIKARAALSFTDPPGFWY